MLKVKEEMEEVGLKLNIQKVKIMASGPITSWQAEGGKVKAVTLLCQGPSSQGYGFSCGHVWM